MFKVTQHKSTKPKQRQITPTQAGSEICSVFITSLAEAEHSKIQICQDLFGSVYKDIKILNRKEWNVPFELNVSFQATLLDFWKISLDMSIVALLLLLAQKALPKSRKTAPGPESGPNQATKYGDENASIFMVGFVSIKIQGQIPIFYGNFALPFSLQNQATRLPCFLQLGCLHHWGSNEPAAACSNENLSGDFSLFSYPSPLPQTPLIFHDSKAITRPLQNY